jgi:hypothetical protein
MGAGLPGAKQFAPPSGVGASQGSNVVTPAAPAQPATTAPNPLFKPQQTVPGLGAVAVPANPYADLLKQQGSMRSRAMPSY